MSIIKSIIDNDFYKFTMQFGVTKLYPDVMARYKFINRGEHQFPEGFAEELQKEINAMASLALTKDEKNFFTTNCPYLSPAYLDFLQGYRYDPNEVKITQNGADVEVHVEGYWYRTILWEVPILCLISEIFYKLTNAQRISNEEITKRTSDKVDLYNRLGVTVAELRMFTLRINMVYNQLEHTLTNGLCFMVHVTDSKLRIQSV